MAATKAQRIGKKTKPAQRAEKPATKKSVAKKSVAKKSVAKKSVAKKSVAKKSGKVMPAAKSGAKRSVSMSAAAKTSPPRHASKPLVAKKLTKVVVKKSAAKAVVKKSAAKAVAKKSAAKLVDGVKVALETELKTLGEAREPKTVGKLAEPKTLGKPKKGAVQLELADWVSSPGKTDSTTPARDARQLLEQRKAIKSALAPKGDGKSIVDAYLRDVDHPFKAEMEAVRQIILGVSPKLSERIKWNAPSFYYKEDLGAFNPRASEFCHLILLFPGGGALPEKSSILEGTHKDRREVKFRSMDDVKSKQRALEKIIADWIEHRER